MTGKVCFHLWVKRRVKTYENDLVVWWECASGCDMAFVAKDGARVVDLEERMRNVAKYMLVSVKAARERTYKMPVPACSADNMERLARDLLIIANAKKEKKCPAPR